MDNVHKADNGCWLWTGGGTAQGYGWYDDTLAHRYSWELHNGPIPDGLWVLHDCPDGDCRLCVNPAHLWLGTYLENIKDKCDKGRQLCGEQVAISKLTAEQVKSIRLEFPGLTQRGLATKYGVTQTTISRILTRDNWKHVT